MDLKKLSFAAQLSFPRRKVASGFGLVIMLSFIGLCVVMYDVSFKAPFLKPVFRGWNSVGSSSNSYFVTWPLSSGVSSSHNATSIIQKPQELSTVNDHVLGGNKSSGFLSSDGKDVVFENAHVGNVSEKLKDGSYFVEEGSAEDKVDGKNGPQTDKSTVLVNGSGKGMELKHAHVGDYMENVKNQNVGVEENGPKGIAKGENVSENSIVNSVEHEYTSNVAKLESPEDGHFGNYSYKGGRSDSRKKRIKVPGDNRSFYKDCDIFRGRWVRDNTKPYYPPGSCPYIDRTFDCRLNGRPDHDFVKWRWQPYECDIPSLNSTDFLEKLRGRKLVFVGDSLNRNMWESLVCLLRHGVRDKKRVYQISGRHEFKKKGFYAFRFEDYNCTLDFVSSPFLVRESSFKGKNGSFETLRLDLMDKTTSMYYDADVLVFNTGHWWTHEKTARGEEYYQEGNYVHPRLKVLEAYKRALATWASWVDKNIDRSKTQVVFRGFSVTHFRGGRWNSGGQCDKETKPIFNDKHLAKYPSKMRVLEYVLKDMKTPVIYLNISRLTDYRKDGHPSVYRAEYQAAQQVAKAHAQDCSHWCLPGVPDTWNELLYASLLKSGQGPWRN